MALNKYSRRKFIRMSSLTFAMSCNVLALTRKPTNENSNINIFRSVTNLSDLEKIAFLLTQQKPAKWLFTGDSITAGVEHTHGMRSYPEIFEEHIRWEMKRPRDIIINSAISGNTTVDILNDLIWRIEQFRPEIVSVMIGTNDCSRQKVTPQIFQQNLESLMEKIRTLGAIPILQTPNPIITDLAPERAQLDDYVKIIQKAAVEKEIILVDNYAYWKEKIKQWSQASVFRQWLNDPLHPNGEGHKQIARLMFKKLSIFNKNDATCRGIYYEGIH